MKNILDRKISKIAGIIIMVITLIMSGITPCICENLIEFMQLFGLTLALAIGIMALDVAIHDEKKAYLDKQPDQYVSGSVNLNW